MANTFILPNPLQGSAMSAASTSTFINHIKIDGYTIDLSAGAVTNQYLEYNGSSFVAATNNIPSSNYGQDLGTSSLHWSQLFIRHIVSKSSSAPSIAGGTGAGTSPTVSVARATDCSGIINVTTGTSPTSNATVATITFGTNYNNAPKVLLTETNANAIGLIYSSNRVYVDTSATSTSQFVIKCAGGVLSGSTAYQWAYIVIE